VFLLYNTIPRASSIGSPWYFHADKRKDYRRNQGVVGFGLL
jgi:hypothetical protein